jgi:uncharacterized protein with PIN domain
LSKKQTAMCPNCGTQLVKKKFAVTYDEKGAPERKNAEEDFYCENCGLRWISENSQPLENEL